MARSTRVARSLPLLKPPALKPGATLGIVSPASTPQRERVDSGLTAVHALGYRTKLLPHAYGGGPLYYAGTREERANDLLAAFIDPEIDGVLCTRGGYGSAELLPELDAELIRANAKPFLGYSDHTSLQQWMRRECGMVTFYAPMLAADFARSDVACGDDGLLAGVDLPSWRAALEGSADWSVGEADGLRVLQPGLGDGTADGPLLGGCLSIFAEALGTPYAPRPEPCVLFLEDIGTKPYQWDRMLLHLRYAGMLEHATGIVFGNMDQCVPPEQQPFLEDALRHALADFHGPVAIGLRSGHVDGPNITLPLGVRVTLDCTDTAHPRMHFREAAVSV
jgi:muramoyltetrapeptide carboxypeptidase